jgi:hypothetical protein
MRNRTNAKILRTISRSFPAKPGKTIRILALRTSGDTNVIIIDVSYSSKLVYIWTLRHASKCGAVSHQIIRTSLIANIYNGIRE